MSRAAATTGDTAEHAAAPEGAAAAGRLAVIAPRPTTLAATGLSAELLGDLASKLLLRAGVLSLGALTKRLGVSGGILLDIMALLRREARIEVRPVGEPELAYALSERGRQLALDALNRDGYVGRAPVRLEEYARVVAAQTVHRRFVTRATMQRAFMGLVLSDDLRDRLGAALNSGRAMFLHGAPGTGKTYVARRLGRAFSGEILVPHALLVDGAVVRLLDPAIHEDLEVLGAASPLLLNAGFDPRYACCERPVVHAGGEVELSMLEVARREGTRELLAPLQLKANNGLLIIDDLGRQRSAPEQILNRWIVPLEERIDHFSIDGSVKTGGLYGIVRHPIYAGYFVSFGAFVIQNMTIANAAIYVLFVLLELLRVGAEERVLSQDPDYVDYARSTRWRVVPFVY